MITGRRFSKVLARLEPLGVRHVPMDHMTPLSLACTLLLCAFTLGADRAVGLLDDPVPVASPKARLQSEIQRALAEVQESMVELPSDGEAVAVAQLANNTQMILLDNRQLAAEVHVLQLEYAELRGEQQTKLTELRRSIDQMLSGLGRLRGQHEKLQDQLNMVLTHQVDTLASPASPNLLDDRQPDTEKLNASDPRRGTPVAGPPAGAPGIAGSDVPVHHVSPPSSFTERDQSPMPAVSTIALNIAHALEETKRQAMLTSQELAFTLDIDKRAFKSAPDDKLITLDPMLEINLYTARSELVAPRIGRIVFFPDGSSTGGRIDLDLQGRRAAVRVDWSTGVVSVES